jgi:hypothetical protein
MLNIIRHTINSLTKLIFINYLKINDIIIVIKFLKLQIFYNSNKCLVMFLTNYQYAVHYEYIFIKKLIIIHIIIIIIIIRLLLMLFFNKKCIKYFFIRKVIKVNHIPI